MNRSVVREIEVNDDRGAVILIVTSTLTVIGTFSYLARVYSRAVLLKVWHLEDYILTAGWVCGLGYLAFVCIGTAFGAGAHVWTLSSSELLVNLKLQFASWILYHTTMGACKLGICVLYSRIFEKRLCIVLCMVYILAIYFSSLFVDIFMCTPIHAYWDAVINPKMQFNCINLHAPLYVLSIVNIIADTWLMWIVIPSIYRLNMYLRQKIILLSVVSLGWLVVGATIYRMVRISDVLKSTDLTYTVYDVIISTAVDVNVSIICASIPCTRPLLRKIMPRFFRWLDPRSRSTVFSRRGTGSSDNISFRTFGSRSQKGSTSHESTKERARGNSARTNTDQTFDSISMPSASFPKRSDNIFADDIDDEDDDTDHDAHLFFFRFHRRSIANPRRSISHPRGSIANPRSSIAHPRHGSIIHPSIIEEGKATNMYLSADNTAAEGSPTCISSEESQRPPPSAQSSPKKRQVCYSQY